MVYNDKTDKLKTEKNLRLISVIFGVLTSIFYPAFLYWEGYNIYYQVFSVILLAALLLSVLLHPTLRRYE